MNRTNLARFSYVLTALTALSVCGVPRQASGGLLPLGELRLLVNPLSKKVLLEGNNATELSAIQLTSDGGTFNTGISDPMFFGILLGSEVGFYAEGSIPPGESLNGQEDLTPVYDFSKDLQDIVFTYTRLTQQDPFMGDVNYVPEPSSLLLVLCGCVVVLGYRYKN